MKLNAKQLYSFFVSDDTTVIIEGTTPEDECYSVTFLTSGDSSTVVIEGTTPELFLFMLRYIYGADEPEFGYLADNYQEIIEITDKYNKIGSKLAAQVAKIASLSIGEDNVTEIMKRTASGSKIMQPSFMCPILKT